MSTSEHKHGRLSRRDFLRFSAVAAFELYFGPVNQLIEWMGKQGGEGNAWQRGALLESLFRDVIANPNDENAAALHGFLGFTAAEYELTRQQNYLAASCVRHFLYGNGETLDISDSYKRIVSEAGSFPVASKEDADIPFVYPQPLLIAYEKDGQIRKSEETLALYFERLFLTSQYRTHVTHEINAPIRTERQWSLMGNDMAKVSGVVRSLGSDDLGNALHYYTLTVSGPIGSPERSPLGIAPFRFSWPGDGSAHKGFLTIAAPTVEIMDHYDFNPGESGVLDTASVYDIAGIFGRKFLGAQRSHELASQLDSGTRQWMKETALFTMNHNTAGSLLAQKRIAHNFKVVGKMQLSHPVTITEW